MESIALLLTLCAILYFLYTREKENREERKDLLDRLMAKDFVEYKEMNQEQVTYEPVSKDDATEFWEEIEANKV